MIEAPSYKAIVTLNEISFANEYPKNMEEYVWGIPGKYKTYMDREISAFCTCWIFDFTRQSFNAAKVIDSWMKGEPFKFIAKREFDFFIMNVNQQEILYKNIRYSDCYYFFDKLYHLLVRCRTLKNLIDSYDKGTPYESACCAFKDFKPFSNKDMDSIGRVNLFLLIMTHMFDDYDYDGASLIAPLFKVKIIPSCSDIYLLKRKFKDIPPLELSKRITEVLKWFSKKNPMTYWVGIATYKEYEKNNKKRMKKFSTMKVIRHPFKKR